jgi:hypothetical protein
MEDNPSVDFNDFGPSSPELESDPTGTVIKEEEPPPPPPPPPVVAEKRPMRKAAMKHYLRMAEEKAPTKKRSCKANNVPPKAKAAPAALPKENTE